jgi:hypothetical protein
MAIWGDTCVITCISKHFNSHCKVRKAPIGKRGPRLGGEGGIFSYPKIHCEINMDAYYVIRLFHYTKVVEILVLKPS